MENLDALNSFLGEEKKVPTEPTKTPTPEKEVKKVFIEQKDGLVERVDKVFVDKSGRQLLREVY